MTEKPRKFPPKNQILAKIKVPIWKRNSRTGNYYYCGQYEKACIVLRYSPAANAVYLDMIYKDRSFAIPQIPLLTTLIYRSIIRKFGGSSRSDHTLQLFIKHKPEETRTRIEELRKPFMEPGKSWHFVGKINPTKTDIAKTEKKYQESELRSRLRRDAKARGEKVPFR